MKKFTSTLLVAFFVVVAFTHQSEADGGNDYLIGYLKSMKTSASEAELKAKTTPELIDMIVAALQKLQGEADDPERAESIGVHIKSFQDLKAEAATNTATNTPTNTQESPLESVSKVHHVEDEEDFDNQLKNAGDKVVLVDFFATWCGPCQRIAPYLDTYAEKYEDRLVVLKVDVDQLKQLAMGRYVVSGMPTFIFFKNGEIFERFSGAYEEKIEATIKKHTA